DTKDSAKECAYFVYAMLARVRLVEGRYKEAMEAFLHGRQVATSQDQRDRVFEEFTNGIEFGRPSVDPYWKLTRKLINKNKYDEIDKLCAENCNDRALR